MTTAQVSIVSLLRDRMQWHQVRQKVLAENVANANTPGFQPRDLRDDPRPVASPSSVSMVRTDSAHILLASTQEAGERSAARFETKPSGNAVTLEDEMMKVADNQSQYQLAASLYQKSLAMLRMAVGARGS